MKGIYIRNKKNMFFINRTNIDNDSIFFSCDLKAEVNKLKDKSVYIHQSFHCHIQGKKKLNKVRETESKLNLAREIESKLNKVGERK